MCCCCCKAVAFFVDNINEDRAIRWNNNKTSIRMDDIYIYTLYTINTIEHPIIKTVGIFIIILLTNKFS